MNTKTIAVLAALVLLVPLSVMAVQDESDAAGESEAFPVELNTINFPVDEKRTIEIRNNETAYSSYAPYTMKFNVKGDTGDYQTVVILGSSDGASTVQKVGNVEVDISRASKEKNGCFDLKITGDSTGSQTIYVQCVIQVTPATGVTVTDEVYYKVVVNVGETITDGTIIFGAIPEITAGESTEVQIPVTAPADISEMAVYATGLPAGINIIVDDNGNLMLTGMANVPDTYSVDVVLRVPGGAAYTGSFDLTVNQPEEPEAGYTVEINAAKDPSSNNWYVLQEADGNSLTLTVTGTHSEFDGVVQVISKDGDSLQRETLKPGSESGNPKTYDLKLDGVGQYVIEITDIDGSVGTYTVNVLPVSTGYGAGFTVVGA